MPESTGANKDLLQDLPGQARTRDARPERTNRPKPTGKAPRREIGGPQGPEPTRYGIGNATADARIFDAPALPRARGRCRFLTCEATGKPSNLAARRRFLHETVDRRSH